MRRGFTLIEMLVVIGIIAILVGASIGGYSAMTRTAEKAKCQELVSNVATALTAMFQAEGAWPKRLLANGGNSGGGKLDHQAAYAFVAGSTKYFSLATKNGELAGNDYFGIVTPWAAAVIKKYGGKQASGKKVGQMEIEDHILHYALDTDGDGRILGANVGGKTINVRATAIVWCGGKDGVIDPYPYAEGGSSGKGSSKSANGRRTDDVYSWSPGQTKNVQ